MGRRPIPRETSFQALFEPNLGHNYLQAAERFPLERTDSYSPVDAWWLAELSLLSYVSKREFVRAALRRAGFPEVEFYEADGTSVFCAGDLIVFRGTDELGDVLKDLDAAPAVEGAAKVHRGFQHALDAVWPELEEYLRGRRAIFTGHSLGGALALLSGWRYPATRTVYTFGCPRVAGRSFRESLNFPVHRVVNNNDVVTRLPPPIYYRHAGALQYIDEKGCVLAQPERWERVKEQVVGHGKRVRDNVRRWLSGDLEAIPFDSVVDHSPLHYAIHLWNQIGNE